jgi:hypothetical protein
MKFFLRWMRGSSLVEPARDQVENNETRCNNRIITAEHRLSGCGMAIRRSLQRVLLCASQLIGAAKTQLRAENQSIFQ